MPDAPMPSAALSQPDLAATRLLAWYDRHRRTLPWRALRGQQPDPYAVWLSEIMLQQTTTVTVAPYFAAFLARWPTVEDLAAAPLDDVLTAWAGLGYYARARNMHRCAQAVATEHAGRFPETEAGLLALPGIGHYTAAAIAAIAFDRPATVVDGNVERVVSRLFAIDVPLPGAKVPIRAAAATLTPVHRPGDFAQAMMDLGATVCTPRRPRCMVCPFADDCRARQLGIAEELPRPAVKPERPTRRGIAFWAERPDGAVLLRRRPEQGLLGGMMEVPSSSWREAAMPALEQAVGDAPFGAAWRLIEGMVRHGFTHFALELRVARALVPMDTPAPAGSRWILPDRFGDAALPTCMRKVVKHALGGSPVNAK